MLQEKTVRSSGLVRYGARRSTLSGVSSCDVGVPATSPGGVRTSKQGAALAPHALRGNSALLAQRVLLPMVLRVMVTDFENIGLP